MLARVEELEKDRKESKGLIKDAEAKLVKMVDGEKEELDRMKRESGPRKIPRIHHNGGECRTRALE